MLKYIQADDPLFDSSEFRKDLVLFEVLARAIRPTAFLLASDGHSYIIARNRADLACWVWTSDDVSTHSLGEILLALRLHFGGRELIVTAKPSVIEAVEQQFAALGYLPPSRMGLIAYKLDHLLPPPVVGRLRLATLEDLDLICAWYRNYHVDCFDRALLEDPRPALEASILAGHSHLLVVADQPVSMVGVVAEAGKPYCLVRVVYTPPLNRGRGYAKQAVADAIKPYLKQGLYAILYADAANPRSNAAYQHIGFEEVGTVIQTTMKLGSSAP